MPVVSIVVAGLGVGAAKTTDAIMKLPSAVTLAFTPYGSDPSKLAERARAQRHEILLQIPMEPFDYPDNDPGPQTLLTTLVGRGRISTGCTGISAAFRAMPGSPISWARASSSTDAAMQPIIREAAKRGLGYLDDGSAPRSTAPALAAAQAMPFAKADFAIDAVPTAVEIDKALAKLESLAKERGIAIGVASALPDFDRADRRLDQGAREPRHHACAIDNRDAEIKIGLNSNRLARLRTPGVVPPDQHL